MDENSGMYRDYAIDFNVYGESEYTVQYDGEDVWFNSYDDAAAFIDSILDEDSTLIVPNSETPDRWSSGYRYENMVRQTRRYA